MAAAYLRPMGRGGGDEPQVVGDLRTSRVAYTAPSWTGIISAKRSLLLEDRIKSGVLSQELTRRLSHNKALSDPAATADRALSALNQELKRQDGYLTSNEGVERISSEIYQGDATYAELSEEKKQGLRDISWQALDVSGLGDYVDREAPPNYLKFPDPRDYLPETPEAREYYDALRKKHFSDDAVGSRFEDGLQLEGLIKSLPEVDRDRPFPEQDDRAYFESQGITGFKDDLGYFRIEGARGVTRLVPDSELPSDEPIEVEEVKPGFLSFVTAAEHEVPTNEATLIVGRNPNGDTPFQVVTAFPGLPWEPNRSGISVDEAAAKGIKIGRTTLGELQALVGTGLMLQSR
jgi:hypothetical protein